MIIISLEAYFQTVGSLLVNNQCVNFCANLCNKFEGDFPRVENHLIADNLTTCLEVENKNESDLRAESEVTSESPEVLGDRTVFEMEFSPQKKRYQIIYFLRDKRRDIFRSFEICY